MPLQKHRYQRTEPAEGGLHRLSRLQTFSFETRTNSTPIIGLDSILRLNHNNNTTESLDSLLERPFEEEAAEDDNDGNVKQDPNLVSGRARDLFHRPTLSSRAAFRQAADTVPLQVTWDGPYDIENPLNWSASRKWTATILVSCFTFISPFSSTMVTPALEDIGDQYDIPEGFARALVLSIFLLGFAQGPFVLAPLSELFGRVKVLQLANLIYLVFNTVCPFAKTKEQLYLFRFLSGIGGSAPQAVSNVHKRSNTAEADISHNHSYAMVCWLTAGAKKNEARDKPSTACSPLSARPWHRSWAPTWLTRYTGVGYSGSRPYSTFWYRPRHTSSYARHMLPRFWATRRRSYAKLQGILT